jgi:orotate phosphoribosyltransferase
MEPPESGSGGLPAPGAGTTLTDEALLEAIREHAYLEGDFVLRSGRRSSFYLDKYRFETRPELLGPLGERIAAVVAEHAPDAVRLAGPELGAVALAAAASLSSGLPFVIVRKEAKGHGTANRLEGVHERGECICLVEDVVTSGGALLEAVQAVREAGLVVRTAVCVVDREEGGADELARHAVRLRALFRAGDFTTT